MLKKSYVILFLVLVLSFGGVFVSGQECIESNYSSGWLNIEDHIVESSGFSNYLSDGKWYVARGTGQITIQTEELPFLGNYSFSLKYLIGTGNDNDTEDFEIVCGGETFEFPDDVFGDNPQIIEKTINCSLNSGENNVSFISTNHGSVHLYEFRIEGDLNCPEPVCGNGIVEENETCDWGENNANSCEAGYGETCSYCSTICLLEENVGPYCGDNICNGNETDLTCSEDCSSNSKNSIKRYSSINDFEYEDCFPEWSCSNFGECYEGMKSRNCFDKNNCGVSYNKPAENLGCELELTSLVEEERSWWMFFTGGLLIMFLGLLFVSKLK